MAGNFRGVLIFVIFVVDLAVTKISTHEKLMPGPYVNIRTWKLLRQGGVAKTSWKRGQLLSVLATNDHYCYPADGVLDSNGFLSMLFI